MYRTVDSTSRGLLAHKLATETVTPMDLYRRFTSEMHAPSCDHQSTCNRCKFGA